MFPPQRGERFVGALHDSLAADIDPRARRHLSIHREPELFQARELTEVRPVSHQVGIGDEHPRRFRMRAEDPLRPPRLHDQRFVVIERLQGPHDGVKRRPVARRAPPPAVDDQLVGILRHFGIEIIVQHAQGRFLVPALAAHGASTRRPDCGMCAHLWQS